MTWECDHEREARLAFERRDEERRAALERARLLSKSGLVGQRAAQTFAAFDRARQPEAYDRARAFSDRIAEPGWRVLLLRSAPVGVGKTHLAAAVAHEAIRRLVPAVFVEVPALVERLRATYGRDGVGNEAFVMDHYQGAGLLVLDDLGKEQATPWFMEKLFLLVDDRYTMGRPVVVTTNLVGKELADYLGAALTSRLRENCTAVTLREGDVRMERALRQRGG